jgi:hypothetical protein
MTTILTEAEFESYAQETRDLAKHAFAKAQQAAMDVVEIAPDRLAQVVVLSRAAAGPLEVLSGLLSPAAVSLGATNEAIDASKLMTDDGLLFAALYTYVANSRERLGPPSSTARAMFKRLTGKTYVDSMLLACSCPDCGATRAVLGVKQAEVAGWGGP